MELKLKSNILELGQAILAFRSDFVLQQSLNGLRSYEQSSHFFFRNSSSEIVKHFGAKMSIKRKKKVLRSNETKKFLFDINWLSSDRLLLTLSLNSYIRDEIDENPIL